MLRTISTALTIAVALAATPVAAGWREGVAAFQRGAFTTAANEFQALVEAQPEAAAPRFMLGQALQRLGHNEAALVHLGKAYELDPSQVAHQLGFGQALMASGALPEAAKVLAAVEAVALPPGQRAAYDRLVTATVGALLAEALSTPDDGKTAAFAAAEEAATALVSAVPTQENLQSLGQLQLGAEHFADAVGTLTLTVGEEGGDWLVYFYLGTAHSGLGQFELADSSLQEARNRLPETDDQPALWRQIGYVQEKLENWEAAIDAYRRAGDTDALARAQNNERIAGENREVEAENAAIQEMQAEAERLERELVDLESKPPLQR